MAVRHGNPTVGSLPPGAAASTTWTDAGQGPQAPSSDGDTVIGRAGAGRLEIEDDLLDRSGECVRSTVLVRRVHHEPVVPPDVRDGGWQASSSHLEPRAKSIPPRLRCGRIAHGRITHGRTTRKHVSAIWVRLRRLTGPRSQGTRKTRRTPRSHGSPGPPSDDVPSVCRHS
jgi:hypothetical protein